MIYRKEIKENFHLKIIKFPTNTQNLLTKFDLKNT